MPKIGPVGAVYDTNLLDNKGRVRSTSDEIDATRIRGLEGIPDDKQTSLLVKSQLIDGDGSHFTVVQQDDSKCPVFMLPTVSVRTLLLSDQGRADYMKKIFDACYDSYAANCLNIGQVPVPKQECAATDVAGTRTVSGHIQLAVTGNLFAGAHFTAMIKPPGTEHWSHVDPTGFLGPQRLNRTQCGGYSTMIEAQAVAKYSSFPRATAKQAPGLLEQFITEIIFKISTWFAGMRNKIINLNPDGDKVKKALFETSYGEMADFNAQELAKKFGNVEIIERKQKEVAAKEEVSQASTKNVNSGIIIWDDDDDNSTHLSVQ